MNKVEQITHLRELRIVKAKLERHLSTINRKILEQEDSCEHIGVDLGYDGYPSTGDKYRCLICGKGASYKYFHEPKYIVHAEEYLPQFDTKDEAQCEDKFDLIQTLTLDILKETPDMSREELVARLNNLMQNIILTRGNTENSKGAQKLMRKYKNNSNNE